MTPNPAPADPRPVIPGYELLDVIAQTATVEVYCARDTRLDREMALKILRPGFVTSHARQRFVAGVRIMAQLQHPGIVPANELGELPDGRPYLVMKLIRGRTLSDILEEYRSHPSSDLSRLLAVFEQVCQTIAYAHFHRIIHRDLKPRNVMIGAFGEVLVMDWGLAAVLPSPDPPTIIGTPAYMPPEQARGEAADERSDVFGLGGILCHILTGAPPFRGESLGGALRQAAAGDVGDAFARLAACGADAELIALCRQCLSPNPADRPADAGAVARAISEYRTAAADRARWAEVNRVRVEEQRKRRRVQLALAATVGLLIIAGGVSAWWHERQLREQLRQTEENVKQAEQLGK